MNAKTTKLKKNYVALAAAIAVLGVIFALFFASNSFADNTDNEQNSTITITGKFVDQNNNPVTGFDAMLNYQGQYQKAVNADGTFSIDVNVPSGTMDSFSVVGMKNGVAGSNASLYGVYANGSSVSESTDIGSITMYYYAMLFENINGSYQTVNQYGSWSWVSSSESNGGGQPIWFRSGSASVSNNQITFSYTDNTGASKSKVWTFTANPGYELDQISLEGRAPAPGPVGNSNVSTDLINSSLWTANAIVGVSPSTIHVGQNIEKVAKADGSVVNDGDTVPHGTTLYITPSSQEGHVAKITVNGTINSTGVVQANGDMTIAATLPEAVTISGVVKADESAVANGNKDFSNILVEKAYAAEVGVEGATVSFTSTDGWNTQTLTNAEGAYALDVQKGMGGVLTISKEGFNTFTKEFTDAELNEDVQVTSELVKATSPQTGDITLYAFAVIAFVLSGAVVLRMSRRPKGLHVK